MNAKRVIRRSLGEGGYASAGFAEECRGATAVKPWGSTFFNGIIVGGLFPNLSVMEGMVT